jgi:hypothetical protein
VSPSLPANNNTADILATLDDVADIAAIKFESLANAFDSTTTDARVSTEDCMRTIMSMLQDLELLVRTTLDVEEDKWMAVDELDDAGDANDKSHASTDPVPPLAAGNAAAAPAARTSRKSAMTNPLALAVEAMSDRVQESVASTVARAESGLIAWTDTEVAAQDMLMRRVRELRTRIMAHR